jgi:hypothetical protein
VHHLAKRRFWCNHVQVAAFSAVMEMVRSERAGGFANQLYGGLLRAALAPDAASGAVVGLIVNKFIACLDVRFVTGGQIQGRNLK